MRLLILAMILIAAPAHGELVGKVRESSPTYALWQGPKLLARPTTQVACESEAQARTSNPATTAVRAYQVKTGAGALIVAAPTLDQCRALPLQRLATQAMTRTSGGNVEACVSTAKYSAAFQPPTCIITYNFTALFGPGTAPPPLCPDRPSNKPMSCPSGTYGSWEQTASVGPAPGCVVTWEPATAPAGACRSGANTVPLKWDAPTANTDGSPLTNLAGYRVVYGKSETALTYTIQVSNPKATAYQVTDLSAGSWFFGVRAYNTGGKESATSNLVPITIQ